MSEVRYGPLILPSPDDLKWYDSVLSRSEGSLYQTEAPAKPRTVHLWVHYKASGERTGIVDHDIAMLPGETRELFVRAPVCCRDCVSMKLHQIPPVDEEFECDHPRGLREIAQDGSDFCPHAEARLNPKDETP